MAFLRLEFLGSFFLRQVVARNAYPKIQRIALSLLLFKKRYQSSCLPNSTPFSESKLSPSIPFLLNGTLSSLCFLLFVAVKTSSYTALAALKLYAAEDDLKLLICKCVFLCVCISVCVCVCAWMCMPMCTYRGVCAGIVAEHNLQAWILSFHLVGSGSRIQVVGHTGQALFSTEPSHCPTLNSCASYCIPLVLGLQLFTVLHSLFLVCLFWGPIAQDGLELTV